MVPVRNSRLWLLCTLWFLLPEPRAEGGSFDTELAPLLRENCTKCHGGAKQKGGLDLRSAHSALKGGESGPAIVPGKPDESRLLNYLHPEADPHMPPKGQLGEEEIALIRDWVIRFEPGPDPEPDPQSPPQSIPTSLPAGIDPPLAIDVLLESSWTEAGLTPAPPIDDAAFQRRLTLDLLGRIPTLEERARFLADAESTKRERLIDHLLASKEHARYLAELFNVVLLEREVGRGRNRSEREKYLLPYLRWAFETNRPWNRIARDLIVGRPATPEERGASWFLYEQRDDPNRMATTTSAALFGKQIQCAQCHNHPVAPEIEQRHYWGLVAFFDRSINVNTRDGPQVAERAAGGYAKFANLAGASSESELVFFTGAEVEEPGGRRDQDALENYLTPPPPDWIDPKQRKKDGDNPKLTTDVAEAPTPKFSRREELARVAIDENADFARAFVNRAWAFLMGRGFVHPVDQMNSAHPPSHPALLDWLAEDFAAHHYDVRRLFRAIVRSRAYALSPSHPAAAPPLPASFARALDKPLPAEALYRSMLIALGAAGQDDGLVAGESDYREVFVENYPDLFADVFSPSVQQSMFATNGEAIDRMLRNGDLPLVTTLRDTADHDTAVRQAFLAILGRDPDRTECERAIEFLNQRADRREEAIRQFLWALFAGAEFRINH